MKVIFDKVLFILQLKVIGIYCSLNRIDTKAVTRLVYPERGPTYTGSSLLLKCTYMPTSRHRMSTSNNAPIHNTDIPTSLNSSGFDSNLQANTQYCAIKWTRSCQDGKNCGLPVTSIPLILHPGRSIDDNLVSLLYVKSLETYHGGVYTCHVTCGNDTYISRLDITLEELVDKSPVVHKYPSSDETTDIEHISPSEDFTTASFDAKKPFLPNSHRPGASFTVGISAAVGIIIALIGGYLLLVRSGMVISTNRNRNSNQRPLRDSTEHSKPPSYDEVLNNPDKYPMTMRNSSERNNEAFTINL